MLHRLVPRRIMLDPRLLLHRLRTSTASYHAPGAGFLARCEAKKGKEEKTQAPPTMDYAGPSTAPASTMDIDCSHLRRRRAGRLACREVEISGKGQDACWRGRPLHCTGRHPAAGSGRLRGHDGGARDAAIRRPTFCWLSGGDLCATFRRGSSTLFGPLPGSRLLSAVGGCAPTSAMPQATCLATVLPSISTISPTGEPITSPARAAHTHICGLDKTPPR
jgi:hypothetical protein